ncbi:PAS domain-containing sensor histidine kinase [Halobacteriales archaeon QS_1_68_20]|nr:MAG: PAS domain-containing sensor histidine kinase [Halobacteriales archaeon QS_1_68_20]
MTGTLTVYVAREHLDELIGRVFGLMVLSFTVWILGSLARLFTLDPTSYVMLTAAKYLGVATAPVWFFLFALLYAGRDRWVSRRVVAALLVVPVVTIVLIATTQFHGLFYGGFEATSLGDASVLDTERGAWFWVFAAYGWGLLAVATGTLVFSAVGQSPFYRTQSAVVVLGITIPWIAGILYIFRDWPHSAVDPTPLGFAVSAVLFAAGVFSRRLIDVVPAARSYVFDALDDAVVVLDTDGRLLDANETAHELVVDDVAVGSVVDEVIPQDTAADGGEYVIETEDSRRVFHTRSARLTDGLGRETGRIVYLNDVTEVVERERRIGVLNRVLRHNIRNELNLISGYMNVLEEKVDPADREYVEEAHESAQRVVELGDKARNLEETIQRRGSGMVVSVPTVVAQVVEVARAEYSHATVDFETAYESRRDARAIVVDEDLFQTAVANLVENAIVHNDGDAPQVTVRIELTDEDVVVSVADDGPGIPDDEMAVLSSSTETPLEHGSGLGLWLVKWTVSLSSGELTFEENDPRGSVVSVTVPAAAG